MARARKATKAPAAAADAVVALDSACWLEFFADTDRADLFASRIEAVEDLVVPVLTIYEVVKKLWRDVGEEAASAALGLMQRGRVVAVDTSLAVEAAGLGMPLADSLIYAAARRAGAVFWTQDADFQGRPGVRHWPKPARRDS